MIRPVPAEDQSRLATVVSTLAQAGFKADPAELSARFGLKLRYEAPAAPAPGFAMTAEKKPVRSDLSDALESWLGPLADGIADAAALSDEELDRKLRSGSIAAPGSSAALENAMTAEMRKAFQHESGPETHHNRR